jgi:hypothetical protein
MIPNLGSTPWPRLMQIVNLQPSTSGHWLPQSGSHSWTPLEASGWSHYDSSDITLLKMMELLMNNRDSADQANWVNKCIQKAAAETLTATHEASDQNDHLRELVIKLQRSHKRSHSRQRFCWKPYRAWSSNRSTGQFGWWKPSTV